ncbi:hypothetical protein CRUP_006424, partial [Coryphaenoides rupestris]
GPDTASRLHPQHPSHPIIIALATPPPIPSVRHSHNKGQSQGGEPAPSLSISTSSIVSCTHLLELQSPASAGWAAGVPLCLWRMFLWMDSKEMALGQLLEQLSTVGRSIDEIMQEECSPLRAADITPDLRKQFAFLSGGRGQNGCPIIVFPEFPAFGEISETEFHNVLTYLTSVPR